MYTPNVISKKFLMLACALVAGLLLSTKAIAEPIDSIYTDEIKLVVGELEQVKVYSLTRLSMTDPEVADVVDADDTEILIVGKSIGQSVLFVWDEHGKRAIMVHVYSQDLSQLKDRISKLFKDANINEVNIKVNEKEGRIVLSGSLPEHKKELFDQIVDKYEDDVLSLVTEENIEELVQIDLQITELNTTLSKAIGIEWITGGAEGTGETETSFGSTFVPTYTEDLPNFDGSIGDFFKIGDFRRTAVIQANIQALLEEGKARILSKPKLVVLSGEEASFLVGGEIPIRTTTSTDGAVQENVEFKEYGIGMTMTPVVRKDKIDVILNIEVSDIDTANAVGDDVAFVTRSAQTQLFLDDGQTIIMAGLIRTQEGELVKRLPFVSNIPVIGALFRSRSTPTADQDTELVISLTPHRIRDNVSKSEQMAKDSSKTIPGVPSQAFGYSKMLPHEMKIPKEMVDYVRSVQEKISKSIMYPKEAEEYGWEGTVKVGLHILNDGTLAFALIKESSGHEVFDDYALATAQNSAPYANFPSNTDLQELNVTIPIVYSMQR